MATLNTKRIEESATHALKGALLRCPTLSAYISENDKTPSWDGQVFVYGSAEQKKSDGILVVPVQVKGTSKHLSAKSASYSCEISDLRNYYQNGGCILFLVSVDLESQFHKIYYSSLQVYDLKKELDAAGKQQSRSIQLQEFPEDSPNEMANIFASFAQDRSKQTSFVNKELLPLDDLVQKGVKVERLSFTVPGIGFTPYNIGKYVSSHEVYLYAKPEGLDIEIPVDKVTNMMMSRPIFQPVCVAGHKHYDIYTCVDMDIQKKMDAVYQDQENIPQTRDGKPLQSSMVVIEPTTGDIVGLEGGVGEKTVARGLNWASSTLGRRPPGSSLKPIAVYGPAMDRELVTPDTCFLDSQSIKLEGTDWLPKNSSRKNYGWVDVRYGVVHSLNTIAAQVMDKLTPAVSYDFLVHSLHMHLEPADKDYAPLAAGQLSIGTTTREMASAYTIFPSGGTYTQGRTFSHIYNNRGDLICENVPVRDSAITEKTAYWMTDILQDAVSKGTGREARLRNLPCAGKTGTTTETKDLWFVGYTPYYVGAVWTGYAKPAKISISGNPAAVLWKQVMTSIHEELPYKDFPVPKDIEFTKDTNYQPDYNEPADEADDGDELILPEENPGNFWDGDPEDVPYIPEQEEGQWGWGTLPWVDTKWEGNWVVPDNPEQANPDSYIPSI